jgi:hypothetical protein
MSNVGWRTLHSCRKNGLWGSLAGFAQDCLGRRYADGAYTTGCRRVLPKDEGTLPTSEQMMRESDERYYEVLPNMVITKNRISFVTSESYVSG